MELHTVAPSGSQEGDASELGTEQTRDVQTSGSMADMRSIKDEELGTSSGSGWIPRESNEQRIISFPPNDPENPYHWSMSKKLYIEWIGSLLVFNATIASALPSGDRLQFQQQFGVHSGEMLVLPTSVFLIGYILGPMVFAPMSEKNGRRPVLVITFLVYTILTLATCFSPNWAALVVFRFVTGIFASPPLSVTGGLYADIYSDPVRRGRAITWFMIIAVPAPGPVCAGYLSTLGWKWPFWFALIFAGFSLPFVLSLPETYGPAILHHRAKKMRKEGDEPNTWAPIDLVTSSAWSTVKVYIGRPIRMLLTETIVGFSSLYLSLIYSTLFLLFQAYAIIFGIYSFNAGEIGLAFLPVFIGCLLSAPIYFVWERILVHATKRGDPWTKREEFKRLPLAAIGGPFFTIGMFWIGWGTRSAHWIVPVLGGFPLGLGFVLIFIALINYMTDAYGIYAASAGGAASIARSLFGVALPFATNAMFGRLGVPWACSVLGFVSLGMCLIPFAFMRYGDRIRGSSRMCQELAKQQESQKT